MTNSPDVTIGHNPECATSRHTLALVRNAGGAPTIIEYLRTPPGRAQLEAAIAAAGLTTRAAIRQKGTPYAELGLGDPSLDDARLLEAMLAHPTLINRPFVFTPSGVRLSRPSEVVLDILPLPQAGPFATEDGRVAHALPTRTLKRFVAIVLALTGAAMLVKASVRLLA